MMQIWYLTGFVKGNNDRIFMEIVKVVLFPFGQHFYSFP